MMYIVLYLVAIIAANLTITAVCPAASAWVSFVFIGFDLVSRDALHDRWRGRNLWRNMLLLIGAGSLLSWLLNANAGTLALASFTAFALAGIADAIVYQRLRRLPWLQRVNGSNVVSGAVDSVVIVGLGFGLPFLWNIALASFLAKLAGGAFWSFVLLKINRRVLAMRTKHVECGGGKMNPIDVHQSETAVIL